MIILYRTFVLLSRTGKHLLVWSILGK